MARRDPEIELHKSWLGLLQPVGLVVSPPALVKAQAVLDQNVVALQQKLLGLVERPTNDPDADPYVVGFHRFAEQILGWNLEDLAGVPGGPEVPEGLELVLPEYNDTLRPTHVVVDGMADNKVLMLVMALELNTPFDNPLKLDDGWQATPQARMERLLRETQQPGRDEKQSVAAGLLWNGIEIRVVYAPRGESSGHVTFPIKGMTEVSGRLILAALNLLMSEHRVFSAPDGRRLSDLLSESRKYQAEVSTKLADQVLEALWELLRGFQAADEAANGRILGELSREDPNHIYGGLLTVLMRMVFLLYAESEGLMPDDEVYTSNYSVGGLYERLREDAGRNPDTMDQRYGAWASLLTLFRLIFDGGGHGQELRLPTRHGQLFDPNEYPFLEGRPSVGGRQIEERFDAPRVSDGCVFRVLEGLLLLDGERLSYRSLDVEQIGSVYEAMMGFSVERAFGPSLAARPKHIVFDVQELLEQPPGKRAKWLKDNAECDIRGAAGKVLKDATTPEGVVAALGRRLSPRTPRLVVKGALYLQPGEERRRSGSHYTPRELTSPIVETTLRPLLQVLGDKPRAEHILSLKVCDPAMGSGAFLVEACRQLAERLVQAWDDHGEQPLIPADEDPLQHARRLVAQRCLYGVDKNPFAVNLAKLSLWLVTLAKDHAFTFVDHALKCGDSLVGLSPHEIGAFHWRPPKRDYGPLFRGVAKSVSDAEIQRTHLLDLGDEGVDEKHTYLQRAEEAAERARSIGNLVLSAYFSAGKDRDSEIKRAKLQRQLEEGFLDAPSLQGPRPFHWEVEFPEVFDSSDGGFHAIVGNPPFLNGTRISSAFGRRYVDFLKMAYPGAGDRADLVASFFRRAYDLLRVGGCFGLIATNTISESDTREAGLTVLRLSGATIYEAVRRLVWPGQASVNVSLVWVSKGALPGPFLLDAKPVDTITAYLFHAGPDESPRALAANRKIAFCGPKVDGDGFIFDDRKEACSPVSEMHEVLAREPESAKFVYPLLGGQEMLNHPTHMHHRWVINFGQVALEEAEQFPVLLDVLRRKAMPKRLAGRLKDYPWWQFERHGKELAMATKNLDQVLMIPFTAKHLCLALVPATAIVPTPHNVIATGSLAAFCTLQSRIHEIWVRFVASSMEDRVRYPTSDCFDTFPLPPSWTTAPVLERAGASYYDLRAEFMEQNEIGLTETYNRFHTPDERSPAVVRLREFHAAMDRAVLDAYGWSDISTGCEFLLDYEIDEEAWGSKKRPYRLRWPDEVHDEVLARLLDLNKRRFDGEVAAGLHDRDRIRPKAKRKRKATGANVPVQKSIPMFAKSDRDGGPA